MVFPRLRKLSIRLPLVLSVIVAAVAGTIGAAMVLQDRHRLKAELSGKALLLARSVAVTASEPVLRGDTWVLYKALRQITQGSATDRETTLLSASIVDPNGRVLAHLDPANHPIGLPAANDGDADYPLLRAAIGATAPRVIDGDDFVESSSPIKASDRTIGVVRVRLSTQELDQKTEDASLTVLLLTLGMTLLGSIFGAVWTVRTLRPLHDLAVSMGQMAQGDVKLLEVSRGDEIGHLIDRFNRMALELDEKRRLEAELAANEKIIALGRITAGVAHEVNNPLAGMLNCLSTLRAQNNDPNLVARYLPLIEKGLKRIEGVVKELLIELRTEDADEIGDPSCLEDVRDLISNVIDPAIILSWDNRLDAQERLNVRKMQQVLLNLMQNAMEAMPNGGTLTFRGYGTDDGMCFEVADSGYGIDPEHLGRIFDPFFTSRANGTGLGLWIVLRLVHSMGGAIQVDSIPHQGTVMRVTIPREASIVARA